MESLTSEQVNTIIIEARKHNFPPDETIVLFVYPNLCFDGKPFVHVVRSNYLLEKIPYTKTEPFNENHPLWKSYHS